MGSKALLAGSSQKKKQTKNTWLNYRRWPEYTTRNTSYCNFCLVNPRHLVNLLLVTRAAPVFAAVQSTRGQYRWICTASRSARSRIAAGGCQEWPWICLSQCPDLSTDTIQQNKLFYHVQHIGTYWTLRYYAKVVELKNALLRWRRPILTK